MTDPECGGKPAMKRMPIRIRKRLIGDALMLLLAAALLLWLADWAIWRVRVWRGGGYADALTPSFAASAGLSLM